MRREIGGQAAEVSVGYKVDRGRDWLGSERQVGCRQLGAILRIHLDKIAVLELVLQVYRQLIDEDGFHFRVWDTE